MAMQSCSNTTIFLIGNPQFYAKHDKFVQVLLHCTKKRRTIRSVCIDEAHLFAQHSSFRVEICKLSATFFLPLFNGSTLHPHLLCFTATLNKGDKNVLEDLVHTTFPLSSQMWASAEDFRQDHIYIKLKITSEYSANLKPIVEHCTNSNDSSYVFANSKKLTFTLLKSLDKKLDSLPKKVGVLHVH